MLKLIYFITNIFFVVSLVAMLFVHRAVVTTKTEQLTEGVAKIKRLKVIRVILIVASVCFFISMCASFIADMKVNG